MRTVRDAEFNDPRLLEVYDAESLWARDDDYFVALVEEARWRGANNGQWAMGKGIGNRKSEIGNRKSGIGNRESEIGNRQSAIGNRQ
jgi:hypothetical protein